MPTARVNLKALNKLIIIMPSLNRRFLDLLHDDYKSYPCFIETGTLAGHTIFAMEPHFASLNTIEISPKYYTNTKARYMGSKINFILGDSSTVFSSLLPTISTNCIFFLDGHYSSGDTGRGVKDCPLVEEITCINNLFIHSGIIIIDDFRLFGKSPSNGGYNEDWGDINKQNLLDIIGGRVTDVYHLDSECAKDDRLVIHIRSK